MNTHKRIDEWFLQPSLKDRVQGYLQTTQAMALHALLTCQLAHGVRGALAEVGTFHGKTLIGLARAAQHNERVVGVDPLKIGATDLAPILERNTQQYLNEDERQGLRILRQLSTDLSVADWMQALEQPARFVHLDGHHARETMLHDLRLAAASLVPGAVIVIDDFLNELHPDLTSGILDALAVQTHLEAVAVIPRMGHIEEGGSKLVCTTKGHAARYTAALDAALSGHLRPWTDAVLGKPVRVYRSSMPTRAPEPAIPKPTAGLPVVFALHDTDGQYWINAAVAMASVAQHASVPLHFYVLHDQTLQPAARARLSAVAQAAQAQLSFKPMALPSSIGPERLHRFSPASLYRLMIPQLLAHEPVVLYLDADLVSHGVDVKTLVDAAPETAPLAGVLDPFIGVPQRHQQALKALQLSPERYLNSGVLVMRPPLIGEDLLAAFDRFFQQHPDALHPDQDFLNLHFAGRWAELPSHFNQQVGVYEKTLFWPLSDYQQKIIHYAGKLKPLQGNLAPGTLVFWMYTQGVPEAAQSQAHMRYIHPMIKEPHAVTREWANKLV
jgi:lipopolysaccharide biosynthesis glycosyltransferase/predicted O-methyltransferase YrrM